MPRSASDGPSRNRGEAQHANDLRLLRRTVGVVIRWLMLGPLKAEAERRVREGKPELQPALNP